MSDEAELIVDCAAAPDDDRPRLVYADFLQQRGDPRGDFIALQCAYEVARAADDDSLSVKLAKRWRKLLDEHEVQWVTGARSVLRRSMKFRRGFIEHALLDDAEELGTVMTQLRPYAPLLRAIDLQRGLGALGRHPSLSVIDEVVAHNVIDLADLQALERAAGRSGLRMLTCAGTGLTDLALTALVQLSQPLARLEFSLENRPSRQIPILGRLAATPARQHLRDLRIRGPATLDDVAEILPQLPQLETLVIHNGAPTAISLQRLAEAGPQLVSLEIAVHDSNVPSGVDVRSLVGAMPKLRYLRLENLGITDAQVYWLASSKRLEQLVRLDLGDNQLGPGAVALCESPHAVNLRKLRLSGNPLSQADKDAIRATPLADQRRVFVR